VNAVTDFAALARFWNVPVGKLAAAAVRGLSGMLSLGDDDTDDEDEPDLTDDDDDEEDEEDEDACPECGEDWCDGSCVDDELDDD
jgi:hypothetical protein